MSLGVHSPCMCPLRRQLTAQQLASSSRAGEESHVYVGDVLLVPETTATPLPCHIITHDIPSHFIYSIGSEQVSCPTHTKGVLCKGILRNSLTPFLMFDYKQLLSLTPPSPLLPESEQADSKVWGLLPGEPGGMHTVEALLHVRSRPRLHPLATIKTSRQFSFPALLSHF